MEENVKLSVSNVEGMTQLEGGKWKRRRSCALNVEWGKRSCGETGE